MRNSENKYVVRIQVTGRKKRKEERENANTYKHMHVFNAASILSDVTNT